MALDVTIDSVMVQDSEPAAAALDGDIVLLSLRAGAYFGLNHVGSEIWRMLAEPCRVGTIFEMLMQRHAVELETLSREVTPFLQKLVDERLARVVEASEAR